MQIGSLTNNFNTIASNEHKTNVEQALSKIGAARELSGKDGANLISADLLNLQMNTMTQQVQNENVNISMLQIADSTLKGVSAGVDRLNELSVAFNNPALNEDQRSMLLNEFNQTKDAIGDMIEQTTYNGKSLFGGGSALGLEAVKLESVEVGSLESVEELSDQVSSLFSNVASSFQKSEVGINNLLASISSTTASYAQSSQTPLDAIMNQFSQNNLGLTATTIASSHNSAILQQQMALLLNF